MLGAFTFCAPTPLNYSPLLVTKRRDRIDAGGAAGGEVAGEEGDHD